MSTVASPALVVKSCTFTKTSREALVAAYLVEHSHQLLDEVERTRLACVSHESVIWCLTKALPYQYSKVVDASPMVHDRWFNEFVYSYVEGLDWQEVAVLVDAHFTPDRVAQCRQIEREQIEDALQQQEEDAARSCESCVESKR
jgi:hypothetical protein